MLCAKYKVVIGPKTLNIEWGIKKMCRTNRLLSLRFSVAAVLILLSALFMAVTIATVNAQEGPVSYGGIEFPLGNKSFADKVVDFNPGSGTGEKDGSAVMGSPRWG